MVTASDVSSTSKPATVELAAVKEAIQQVTSAREALQAQRLQREANLSAKHPGEGELRALDSSVKRNTALIKRLQKVSEETRDGLLDDLRKVNQSKYVSEAVTAVAEAPLRMTDLPAAVAVASALNQRYADFAPQLLATLSRALGPPGKGAVPASAEEERAASKRKRPLLRLLADLVLAGAVPQAAGQAALLATLRDLAVASDLKKDREAAQNALALLSGLARALREPLLGAPPASTPASGIPPSLLEQDVSELPAELQAAVGELRTAQALLNKEVEARFVLPPAERQQFVRAVERAFESGCASLVEEHQALGVTERENAAIASSRGDLPEAVAAEYERRRKAYETLHRSITTLAESLDKPMPALQEDAFTRLGNTDSALATAAGQAAAAAAAEETAGPVFEDQEMRVFYESLPDLRSLVPAVLLGGDKDAVATASAATHQDASTPAVEGGAASEGTSAGDASTAPASAPATTAATASSAASTTPPSAVSTADGATAADPSPGAQPSVPEVDKGQLELLLSRLQQCVSKDLCDELAVNFCFCNSKAARRRLVRALCDVPRSSLQLLPFYARIIATLAQALPDIPAGVVSYLEEEFTALLAKKDPSGQTLEARVRNCRYLGELTKFKVVPPVTAFTCLKQLLEDFTNQNIDAACALVETTGRFLLRMPETRTRTENMLEVMMRLKNVKNLTPRHVACVDGAYFIVKQPQRAQLRRKQRPHVQEYIRHLIFVVLAEGTIVDVLKKLLKVPWAQQERYILKCMMKVVRGRYTNIPLVASLAGGLSQYHEGLGIALVDAVLEDVRWGLENPSSGNYQKRMADIRLLGELYNYMLCNSTTIFETLYLLISFGHDEASAAEKLDPPDDFFRVRLVCALMDECGCYFSEGAAKTKLDRFLTFFQAYVLSKAALPLDVEFDMQDVLHSVRPALVRFEAYEDAVEAVAELLNREAATAAANALKSIAEDDDDSDNERRGGPKPSSTEGDTTEVEADSGSDSSAESDGGWREEDRVRQKQVQDQFDRDYLALVGDLQAKVVGLQLARPAAPPPGVAPQQYSAPDPSESVSFKMLMRRGGKDDKTKELQVPVTTGMAMALQRRADEEATEKEQIKLLTLRANRQQQQSEMVAAMEYRGGPGGGQQHFGAPRDTQGGGRHRGRGRGSGLDYIQ